MKTPTFRDVELLSAYLDGKLSQADSTRLESRLKTDPELRSVLNDLSSSRSLLRKLPQRRAPRNFTLTPQMARVKPPLPRAVPALRWATSLATLLLFVTIAANALSPSLMAPSFGRGGGGGGAPEAPMLAAAPEAAATEAPLATEALALDAAPAATEAPTEAPLLDNARITESLPTETMEQKDTATVQAPLVENAPITAPEPASTPIPLAWQIGLLVVALSTGGLAYILAALADNSWRRNVK